MRLEDTDWDDKRTDELAYIGGVSAGNSTKALNALRNPLAILAVVLAWSLHRILAGSWL